ncbi:MAG: hypothetical protein PWR20_1462 [Bacteroidales bacterium]|jgi:hypothetical protein|nr:hypothetical protein [Bacteroidales bacterium]MDN5330251.1 hypothetical protein [Bacteroidales bacterium]
MILQGFQSCDGINVIFFFYGFIMKCRKRKFTPPQKVGLGLQWRQK